MNTGTNALSRVGMYRQAARQILRHRGLTTDERATGLLNLVRKARGELHGDLSIRSMEAEVAWSIDRDDVVANRHVTDPMERRHRAMRGEGFAACPRCLSRLSGPLEWEEWRQIRESAIRELEAREGAVPAYVVPS